MFGKNVKLDLMDLAILAIVFGFLLIQFAPLVIETRSVANATKQGNGTAISAVSEKIQ